MAGNELLISFLASGDNEKVLGALTAVRLNSYATGRSSRGVLQRVLAICSNSDSPSSFRVLGYEILFTLTASVDVAAYRGLVSLARQDMLSADSPDLTLCALSTLRSLPAPLCVDVLLTGDADKTMCDAMAGDAPSHVRSLSAVTFARVAVNAWMQVGESRHGSGGSAGARAFEGGYAAWMRARAKVFDRAVEVLKGVLSQCADKDAEVAGACFGVVRGILETAPYVVVRGGHGGGGTRSGEQFFKHIHPQNNDKSINRLSTSLPLVDSLLGQSLQMSHHHHHHHYNLSSSSSSSSYASAAQFAASSSGASFRTSHSRLVKELCRRASPRVGLLMQRVQSLRPQGKAHAVRSLTLILSHAIAEAAGSTGAIDTPAIMRMDHMSSSGELGLAAVVSSFFETVVVPIASRPFSLGASGTPLPVGASLATEMAATCSSNSNLASYLAQIEAARAFAQLSISFCARDELTRARAAEGDSAVSDLLAAASSTGGHGGPPRRGGANDGGGASDDAGVNNARALLLGGLSVNATNSYTLSTLSDGDQSEYGPYCGSLWPLIGGGDAQMMQTSTLGATCSAIFKRHAAVVIKGLTGLLRRVGSSGAGPAVVVSVASSTVNPAVSAYNGVSSGSNGSASPPPSSSSIGGGIFDSNSSSSSSSSSQGQISAGSGMLGSGAGSSLLTDGMLLQPLHIFLRICESIEAPLFLQIAPALIREIGRVSDDVVDDAGSGVDHSGRRVRLLMRVCGMVVHAALVEAAPLHPLKPWRRNNGSGSGGGGVGKAFDQNGGSGDFSLAYSTLLSRIMYNATRPLKFAYSSSFESSASSPSGASSSSTTKTSSSLSSSSPTNDHFPNNDNSSSTTSGDVHSQEISNTSTRFRAEIVAVMLQSLARVAPMGAVLAPLAAASTHVSSSSAANHHLHSSSSSSINDTNNDVKSSTIESQDAVQKNSSNSINKQKKRKRASLFETVSNLTEPRLRLDSAEGLHTWLSFSLDTLYASLWVLDHRLSLAGIATMSRDSAAAELAKVMGNPDAPTFAPCPVPNRPPHGSAITGISLAFGPARSGDLTVGARPDNFSSGSSNSSSGGGGDQSPLTISSSSSSSSSSPMALVSESNAGGSGGVGIVTGWSWMREFEAVAEASECAMNLLCVTAALILPPPVAKTYIPGAQEGGATAIPAALALDILPPAVLQAHRAGLQKILHLTSKMDLSVYRSYELERVALAMAPRVASQAAAFAASSGFSAGITRGSSYDALPSVVPLQLRILFLLSSAWDGSDGGALTAGVGAAGTLAGMAFPRAVINAQQQKQPSSSSSSSSILAGSGGIKTAPNNNSSSSSSSVVVNSDVIAEAQLGGGLKALLQSITQAERAASIAGGGGGEAAVEASKRESELYRNTTLSVEALRQKRLSSLAMQLASEAGAALGLGTDLELSASNVLSSSHELATSIGSDALPSSSSSVKHQAFVQPQPHQRQQQQQQQQQQRLKVARALPVSSTKNMWERGSKLGRALGSFASQLVGGGGGTRGEENSNQAAVAAAEESLFASSNLAAWTVEGEVVSMSHFWLLIDMMSTLASSQRCTSPLIKRSVECILVQPSLTPDVRESLLVMVPRLSLFTAAYGRSQIACELAEIAYSIDEGAADNASLDQQQDTSTTTSSSATSSSSSSYGVKSSPTATTTSSNPLHKFRQTVNKVEKSLRTVGVNVERSFQNAAIRAKRMGRLSKDEEGGGGGRRSVEGSGAISRSLSSRFRSAATTSSSSSSPPQYNAGVASMALVSATDSTSIFFAVARLSAACARDPWALSIYNNVAESILQDDYDNEKNDDITTDNVDNSADGKIMMNRSSRSSIKRMFSSLRSLEQADDPSAPTATLELLADLCSTSSMAAIAAVSLPELTTNTTLGLNRSAASGARMRTIPAISSAHSLNLGTSLASLVLSLSPEGLRRGADTKGVCLPISYLGSVPAETAAENGVPFATKEEEELESDDGEKNDDDDDDDEGKKSLHHLSPTLPPSSLSRDSLLLSSIIATHSNDSVLRAAMCASTSSATITPLSSFSNEDRGSRRRSNANSELLSSTELPREQTVLTSSSDPICVTMSHTPHASAARVFLHITLTNTSHIRFPPGVKLSLNLGGVLMFERGGVVSGMIASASSRLGTAVGGGGGEGGGGSSSGGSTSSAAGGGAASAGATLSGDFIFMQRTSQHHATHTITQALPPGATVTWDVALAAAGFGNATAKVQVQFESIELLPNTNTSSNEAEAAAISTARALSRASRSVGSLSIEEKKGDDDDDEVYTWEHAGISASSGGITGAWAGFLLNQPEGREGRPQQKVTSGGLIWTGDDLNKQRMGRLLPLIPTPGLTISRTSATRAPPPPLLPPQAQSANPSSQSSLTRGGSNVTVIPTSTLASTVSLASTLSRASSSLLGTPTRQQHSGTSSTSSHHHHHQQQRNLVAAGINSLDSNDDHSSSSRGGNSNEMMNSGGEGGADGAGDDRGGHGGEGGGASEGGEGGGGGGGGEHSDTAASENSTTRHYISRKISITSLTYHISCASLFLRPTLSRLPPALALAICCGVDLLPGSSNAFGEFGPQSLLAAACVEGGGILLSSSSSSSSNDKKDHDHEDDEIGRGGGGGFGKSGGATSGGASGSSGVIATLKNALFASAAARAPYVHVAVAVSQPFMAIPYHVDSATNFTTYTSLNYSSSSSSSSSSSVLPLSSPAWLVACCVEGTCGKWSRIPLPLAPQVFSQSIKSAAASFSSRAAVTAAAGDDSDKDDFIRNNDTSSSSSTVNVTKKKNTSSSSLSPVVCQAAFASRTWAGASVILFFTAVLTPLNEKYPTYAGADGGRGGGGRGKNESGNVRSSSTSSSSSSSSLLQPCMWQVSLQVRSDDARVRAALAVDMPRLVHELFCGRLSLLSHGQGPSAESLLASRADLFSPSMSEPKGASDAVSYAITAMQDRSASLHAKIAAEIPVIFNASSASSTYPSTSSPSRVTGASSAAGSNPNSPLIDEEDEEEEEEEEEVEEEEEEEEVVVETATAAAAATATQSLGGETSTDVISDVEDEVDEEKK